jgi:hypothetical protein
MELWVLSDRKLISIAEAMTDPTSDTYMVEMSVGRGLSLKYRQRIKSSQYGKVTSGNAEIGNY